MTSTTIPRGEAVLQILEKLDQLFEQIINLFVKAIQQHRQAETSEFTTERESAGMTLKSTLEMLEKGIGEFRDASQAVSVTDITELCMVSGSTPEKALLEAREEIDGWKETMKKLEEEVGEYPADVVYGFSRGIGG